MAILDYQRDPEGVGARKTPGKDWKGGLEMF